MRRFIELCAAKLGWNSNKKGPSIIWEGEGLNEIGIRPDNGKAVIKIDSRYFRPSEVDRLIGDSKKAQEKLGWKPKYKLDELISEMIVHDREEAKKELILSQEGYKQNEPLETIPEIMGRA